VALAHGVGMVVRRPWVGSTVVGGEYIIKAGPVAPHTLICIVYHCIQSIHLKQHDVNTCVLCAVPFVALQVGFPEEPGLPLSDVEDQQRLQQ
jgi:hypothetical protein